MLNLGCRLLGGTALVATALFVGSNGMEARQAPTEMQRVKPSGQPVKVSQHVWVIQDGAPKVRSNVGMIVGDKATLVIDSGLGTDASAIREQLAPLNKNATVYLTATHFHPEHILGESE